jgi:hypothetical protein
MKITSKQQIGHVYPFKYFSIKTANFLVACTFSTRVWSINDGSLTRVVAYDNAQKVKLARAISIGGVVAYDNAQKVKLARAISIGGCDCVSRNRTCHLIN